ncbi:hypothetical protein D0Y60_09025 [Shinella sp. WSJ-2]|uniref:hypothetical protein n=1 Tax=Shinella sp. WSJ-2 TaxID=2303749 RepID=UPI000E3DA806|nr:hypothetical protein [Shinella sp. WSJ-2]RFZ87990.1 hypothetical protein D0Y60_09025 [Shinella sp. WSJ-2]
MNTRPFPIASIALTVTSAAILTLSSGITERHCAFGFGGFQCNSPFAGYGDMLLIATVTSLVVLAASAAVAIWRLIVWFRAR